MNRMFVLGDRVRLVSFHGEAMSPVPVEKEEDFWRLVGSEGEVVSDELKVHPAFPGKGGRVLVRFNIDLGGLGLPSHNSVRNSLWIFVSDLEPAR